MPRWADTDLDGPSFSRALPQVHANVPHPLVENSNRCTIRYESLETAQAACCRRDACEAVVRDNGIFCRAQGGGGNLRYYELRNGVTSIMSSLRHSAQQKLGGAQPVPGRIKQRPPPPM